MSSDWLFGEHMIDNNNYYQSHDNYLQKIQAAACKQNTWNISDGTKIHLWAFNYVIFQSPLRNLFFSKVECVFQLASILPQAEFGPKEKTHPTLLRNSYFNYVTKRFLIHIVLQQKLVRCKMGKYLVFYDFEISVLMFQLILIIFLLVIFLDFWHFDFFENFDFLNQGSFSYWMNYDWVIFVVSPRSQMVPN